MDLIFDPMDLPGNATMLVEFFDCGSEDGVPVASFVIEDSSDRLEVEVEEGKYKTALFLLYASILVISGWRRSCRFVMNDHLRKLVREYFGTSICDDALMNPETKHTSVQMLLLPGATVELAFK